MGIHHEIENRKKTHHMLKIQTRIKPKHLNILPNSKIVETQFMRSESKDSWIFHANTFWKKRRKFKNCKIDKFVTNSKTFQLFVEKSA